MLRRTRIITFITNRQLNNAVQRTTQKPRLYTTYTSTPRHLVSYTSGRRSASSTSGAIPPQFIAPNIKPFHLADVGEGIAEVEILQWFVKQGDAVKEFDKICEVQSDKATLEITSRYEGEILRLEYEKGDTAKVGTPLLFIRLNTAGHQNEVVPAAQSTPAVSPAVLAAQAPAVNLPTPNSNDKVLAAPAVRRIARELGIDLSKIVGTGKQGRVTKEDLLAFQNSSVVVVGGELDTPVVSSVVQDTTYVPPSTPQISAIQSSGPEERREPVRGIQKAMIKTMTAATSVPHFGYHEDFSMDALTRLRDELKPLASKNGVKITYLPLLIKMASIALQSYPIINSSLSSDLSEVIYKRNHNIGIAVDTPQGLIVPNIKRVQDRSILEIAQELNRLQKLAAEGKLGSDDLSGGTFTISNIGSIGGTYASPILMPGEVVICALGKIKLAPKFTSDGSVRGERVMPVSFSGDHRIIDGATIANFSNLWKSLIENPSSMFLYSK